MMWSSAMTANVQAVAQKYFKPDLFVCLCEYPLHILLTRLAPKLIEGHQHVDMCISPEY